jgi:hypothetical protein
MPSNSIIPDTTASTEFQLSYGTWDIEVAAERLDDLIMGCDNTITLMESAIALDKAVESITAARKRLDSRLYELQYPSLFVKVA